MAFIDKVIVLVDVDCFYCQVEEQLNPNLRNKPAAVVQYNTWREGGIIAANYLAREKGVTKGLWCYEAKEKCPDILFATVSQVRGRADLTKYREAGKQVANVLQAFTSFLERASVDEAYLDITEEVNKRLQDSTENISIEKLSNTYVVGYDVKDFLDNVTNSGEFSEGSYRLAMGASIVEEIRAQVLEKTGYRCSAGIAHNKMLAKLACGINKPNAQTILPQESVTEFYRDLPLEKIKSLGGKFGKSISEELQISNMGQLMKFTEKELILKFEEKTGKWLYNIARGINLEPVRTRLIPKSISCCKRFPGKNCLVSSGSVERWVNELAIEISERLEKDMKENSRKAKQIVVSFAQSIGDKNVSSTRTNTLNSYEQTKIEQDCLNVIRKFCLKSDGTYNNITYLGLSAGNFQNINKNSKIEYFFKNPPLNEKIFEKRLNSSTETSSVVLTSTNSQTFGNDEYNLSPENRQKKIKENHIAFEEDECEYSNKIRTDDDCALFTRVREFKGDISKIKKTKAESFFNEYFECNSSVYDVCSTMSNISNDENRSETDIEVNTELDEKQILGMDKSLENFIGGDGIHPENEKKNSFSNIVSNMDCQNSSKSDSECSLDYKKQVQLEDCRNHEQTELQSGGNHGVKRKVDQMKPMLDFLQKYEDLNEDNSEYCNECKKRIKFDEMIFHTDYHTARQLHQQINCSEVKKLSESNTKNSRFLKSKNKRKNYGNIRRFLNIT